MGLPPTAPRLVSALSAWLRALSPLLLSPQHSVLSPVSPHGCAHCRRFCSVLSTQSSVLFLRMAARTVAAFAQSSGAKRSQSSVLFLRMAARTVAAFAQSSGATSSVLSPVSPHGCAPGRRFCSVLSTQSSVLFLRMAARTVAAFAQSSALSPQSCFSAWLRALSPLLLSPQGAKRSSVLSPASLLSTASGFRFP